MNFLDKIQIKVFSGSGGRGSVSFKKGRFAPKGPPDGGDGGKGGDVIFRSFCRKRTLYHLKYMSTFRAENGRNGMGSNRNGKSGKDIFIDVPVGTEIIDLDNDVLLYELINDKEFFIACYGGKGGRGNSSFKHSTNRTPKYAQLGGDENHLNLELRLKLIADVGIIGLPNAGKSTLLGTISSAKVKIGAYPFTTIVPNLGTVFVDAIEPFIVADIPGIIEGAHTGLGLGIDFLKHIERTNVLVYIIDSTEIDLLDPLYNLRILERELALYDKAMVLKPSIYVLSKIDMQCSSRAIQEFKNEFIGLNRGELICISSLNGDGIDQLLYKISQKLLDVCN